MAKKYKVKIDFRSLNSETKSINDLSSIEFEIKA